ncbi:MAG: diphosphate--fructose-6-phosphate 1-phosphotransferase [Solibacillus sp.]
MKILIVHGGGPTAVLNSSLYGVITEANKHRDVEVYAAKQGFSGILNEQFIALSGIEQAQLKKLLVTPGSVIGSSRDVVKHADYEKATQILLKNGFEHVLFNGGNGTMDTAGKIGEISNGRIKVIGIPKTVDNDLSVIDHAPGFASAANFIAHSTKEIGEDIKSLPIHVSIIEVMGRNVGWLTAASALAKKDVGDAPHLIYLPEVAFDEEVFLADITEQLKHQSGVVVVVSEGLKNTAGEPLAPPILKTDRAIYFGDVGTHLAQLVISELGYKARSEKLGLFTRAAVKYISDVDRTEAIEVGKRAVQALLQGDSQQMVGIMRDEQDTYCVTYPLIPLERVMLEEKQLPRQFMNEQKNGVSQSFIDWCKPLIDEELTDFFKLEER